MKEPILIEAHSSTVLGLPLTQDSCTLIFPGMDNLVKLWPASDWKPIKTFKGHASSANSVVKPSDEKTLAIGSTDTTVK